MFTKSGIFMQQSTNKINIRTTTELTIYENSVCMTTVCVHTTSVATNDENVIRPR